MGDQGELTIVQPAEGEVIAGRYELGEILGRGGGGGVVRRARDRVLERDVAVKSLRPGVFVSEPRIRREIAALRLLRIPGVVSLHDEVDLGDVVHVIMDLVQGEHFPGTGRRGSWDEIAPCARVLLETLGRVHAAGVVHRDLKPANVLVDPSGRVTLLDFGLSYGPALGKSLTMTGAVVGTPEYLAPEQIRGRGIDGRTDIYALGVMLYEALAGHLPIEARDFADLLRRKVSGSTVPLGRAAPDVPADVASVIDRMLAISPEDRPQSALAALRMLFGDSAAAGDLDLPRLGPSEVLGTVLAAAREGRSLDVAGAAGSGRSRLLADAARVLETEGRQTFWARTGRSPYASLSAALGGFEGIEELSGEEAFATLDERLAEYLAGGGVVIVDRPSAVDPWSTRALERCRTRGAVLRAVEESTADALVLGPLSEEDLRPLFAGPSRLLHLPEDGAAELWRRTGGQPAHVRAEISAWVRHGFAEWRDERIVVDRAALSRLAGGLPVAAGLVGGLRARSLATPELDEILAWMALVWPHGDFDLLVRVAGRPRWVLEPEIQLLIDDGLARKLPDGRMQPLVLSEALQTWPDDERRDAHRAIGAALPVGTPGRLLHLAAGGELDEVATEAIERAATLVEAGRAAEARGALSIALDAARREGADHLAARLLVAYVRACLSESTPSAANEALYEIGRAPTVSYAVQNLHAFLLAVLETQRGSPARALEMLDACGPFEDEDIELWRHSQRVRAASRLSVDAQSRVLDEIAAWADQKGNVRARANHRMWSAALHMRKGEPLDAARLHEEAARESESAPVRMASILNAGSALLEAGRLEEALAAGETAKDIAAECRHPLYEAWAESLVRDVNYRLGRLSIPDAELLAAVETIGSPELEAVVTQTEAATAWRMGRRDEARAFATRAAALWSAIGYDAPHLVARSLEVDCGDTLGDGEAARILAKLDGEPDEVAAAQACALLVPHAGEIADGLRGLIQRIHDSLDAETRDAPREVMSVTEAAARAGLEGSST